MESKKSSLLIDLFAKCFFIIYKSHIEKGPTELRLFQSNIGLC